MAEQNIKQSKHVVEVEFNQQQTVILSRLQEDGKYGKTDAEIIRAALREFLRQTRI
jgi:Arc/MetJ-type ribon-helix-helix transcriptional regulator